MHQFKDFPTIPLRLVSVTDAERILWYVWRMTIRIYITPVYLVKGTYLVKHADSKEEKKKNGRQLVQADSELKAIMTAAHKFMDGDNYAMFTWLKVKAERVDQ